MPGKWQPEDGVVAHGGGVQTTALMVLAGQGRLSIRTFLFANVGDDSEDPQTIAYMREIARPYAAARGLALHELRRVRRDRRVETLYGELTRPGSQRLLIPVYGENGRPGHRSCTADFKIKVLGRWERAHGASPARPAIVAMGISLDEIWRANAGAAQPWERLAYPLLGMLDGRPHDWGLGPPLRRSDCEQVILGEPLPGGPDGELAARLRGIVDDTDPATGEPLLAAVTRHDLKARGYARMPRPGKSACWFCPKRKPSAYQVLRQERPATFARAAGLEQHLIERQQAAGRRKVFLTWKARPIGEVIAEGQGSLLDLDGGDEGGCDTGHCFT